MINLFYIFKELFYPFFLTTSVLAGILLMDKVYQFIPFLENIGLSLTFLLKLVLFSLPTVLIVAIPIGLMIGVYIGINRLAGDSEIIAMRASGISLSFLIKPVLLLSIGAGLFTAMQTLLLSPHAVKAVEDMKFNILKKQTKINLQTLKINRLGDKLIYILDENEKEKLGIFISNWENPDSEPLFEAERGNIEFDEVAQRVIFHLKDGKIHLVQEPGEYRIIHFKEFDFELSPPKMNSNLPDQYQKDAGHRDFRHDIEIQTTELIRLIKETPKTEKFYFEYLTEFHSRFIPPLACIVLAFFTLPVGITNPRNPRGSGVLTLFLVNVFYYTLYSQAYVLSDRGGTHFLTLYLPSFLTLVFGILYFLKTNYDIDSLKILFRKSKVKVIF